ncbi:unnamed protein product [Psylliodes chrysocephalus]|uniref:Uncharacterized protein n=1 Tax=Psylliodes chrysocephalus TaxID=3402493 RepID=A0A9P0GI86_9CUCU|nr:unnamed protein product [Psylliodes chrysocephala]
MQGKPRCCKRHLRGNFVKQEEESRIPQASNTTTLTAMKLHLLLDDLRSFARKGSLNFNVPGALSDTDCIRLTGITASNFENLFQCVKGSIRNTTARSSRTCLAILLMKLRTGLSHSSRCHGDT